jgi:ZIP family zinc transporter
LAASSLLLGALLGVVRAWPRRAVGLALAFGAGALIAAVSFELALAGVRLGGTTSVAVGLGVGALTYYLLNRALVRQGRGRSVHPAPGAGAAVGLSSALALGAVLDGVPEQLVLGTGLVGGPGVDAALLLAVFVSNVPEAIGSAADMRAAGRPATAVWRLWVPVMVICTSATVVGYALADVTTSGWSGGLNGFAAGALLVMLIDSMIPAAAVKAGPTAGLATVLGFAIATSLSFISL